MAKASKENWESEVGVFLMEPIDQIVFQLTSGSRRPLFQIKSVCWSIFALHLAFLERGFFSESTWITALDSDVLGVGKVVLEHLEDTSEASNATSRSRLEDAYHSSNGSSSNETRYPNARHKVSPSLSPSVVNAPRRRPLQLAVTFTADGHQYPFQAIFKAAMYNLMTVAPFDCQERAGVVGRYISSHDFTMVIFPSHRYGQDDYKWWMTVDALWMMTDLMRAEGPRGHWAEAVGRLRYDGNNVARMILGKGNLSPSELDAVWTRLGGDDDMTFQNAGISVEDTYQT